MLLVGNPVSVSVQALVLVYLSTPGGGGAGSSVYCPPPWFLFLSCFHRFLSQSSCSPFPGRGAVCHPLQGAHKLRLITSLLPLPCPVGFGGCPQGPDHQDTRLTCVWNPSQACLGFRDMPCTSPAGASTQQPALPLQRVSLMASLQHVVLTLRV